ncbi:MAG: DUF108 domain-containing protein [Candidatus Omnitrophica bacterium]|nr:DUF108 domain-containing protein [Candidatus Omnitrophota bacterium]
MIRVGLIGCGTIGSQLALALQRSFAHAARLAALHDADRARATALQRRLHPRPPIVSLPDVIRRSDLVLEAASVAAVPEVIGRSLRANRDVLVMSVGGLLTNAAWRRLLRRSRARLYIPSGALAGLDGIKAMALGRLASAQLTTRKPPRALRDAPYVRAKRLRLERLTRPAVIFQGTPRQVVKAFPQNTNVAAALSLASGLPNRRIRVRVVADPALRRNQHEVEVTGDCGRIQCRIESRPSANPKTSELAVRSAVATLHRIFDNVSIGT